MHRHGIDECYTPEERKEIYDALMSAMDRIGNTFISFGVPLDQWAAHREFYEAWKKDNTLKLPPGLVNSMIYHYRASDEIKMAVEKYFPDLLRKTFTPLLELLQQKDANESGPSSAG